MDSSKRYSTIARAVSAQALLRLRGTIAALFSVFLLLHLGACGNPTVTRSDLLPEFAPLHPEDSFYETGDAPQQWNLHTIEMARAWGTMFADEVREQIAMNPFPRSVVVAVLDTAVDVSHPDLAGNTVPGHDFTSDNGEISGGAMAVAGDAKHHGTHVAGVIAAETDNGEGIAGIGWNRIELMPVTVLDEHGSGSESTLIDGLMFAAGLVESGEPAPSRRADVINLSLGQDSPSSALEGALDDVRNEGITLVAAAGNADCDTSIVYPAAYPSTIAVGSANPPDFERADYSNCGDSLDLVAPGGNGIEDSTYASIFSLGSGGNGESYVELFGTSMATPHVSAVAAMLYAISEVMNPGAAAAILRETATPVSHASSLPSKQYGWGMLHAERAVRRALMFPYGPYANDGSAVTSNVASRFTTIEDPERDRDGSGSGGERGSGERQLPSDGSYREARVVLAFDQSWYSATARADRQVRFEAIAGAHGLQEIRDRGHRFPVATLEPGRAVTPELLEELESVTEIESASYDSFTERM